ncbi:MAG: TetR/AcrR family transcriptional regulator [Acidimicrobiales bacterium]
MAATRDRIIVATNELFRRHGYHGTSLSQISEAADATTGSIYHFFPGGKEALAVAVITTTGAVYRELFESIAAEALDPRGCLRRLLRRCRRRRSRSRTSSTLSDRDGALPAGREHQRATAGGGCCGVPRGRGSTRRPLI